MTAQFSDPFSQLEHITQEGSHCPPRNFLGPRSTTPALIAGAAFTMSYFVAVQREAYPNLGGDERDAGRMAFWTL